MRVLYILPYDWGAMPQYTAEIANSVSNEAEVFLIGSSNLNRSYFNSKVNLLSVFAPFNFTLNDLVNLFSIQTLRGILSFKNVKLIKDINPDVIHLTTPIIPPLAIYLKYYRLDKKYHIIYTKHGVFSNSGLKEKILEEYILGWFEKTISYRKIIVHTQQDKNILIKQKNILAEKISVIPHGVYSFFKKYGEKMITEKNCILFFGNIREYKGLRYLIQAIPKMLDEIPDLKVIIAGEGDISEFANFIKEHEGVFEVYNEFIPDSTVSELFQRAEVVVMPYTIMSGQSGILNVALAYHKPIVASNVGGIHEVVENGINGYLVPPKNPMALADAIVKLLLDRELISNMQEKMLTKSEELSWENIAQINTELYRDILKPR